MVALSEVEKAFIDNKIVPDTLNAAPKKVVDITYPSGVSVELGKQLTPTQVKDTPKVEWAAEKGVYYSLLMVDPDAPSRKSPRYREVRHWLVMNIFETAVESGDEVFEYRGSGAPNGTGLHRYIFLIYKQPDGIILHNEPRSTKRNRVQRILTSTSKFANKYNLSDPEFGNFFQAEYDEYVDLLRTETTDSFMDYTSAIFKYVTNRLFNFRRR